MEINIQYKVIHVEINIQYILLPENLQMDIHLGLGVLATGN